MVSGHQASVDSFEPGRITRETISATTMSRARHRGPSSVGRPNWRAIAATAATCPCGSDRTMLNSLPAATSVCPFSVASSAVTASAGSLDKLASVSCFTLPPSR